MKFIEQIRAWMGSRAVMTPPQWFAMQQATSAETSGLTPASLNTIFQIANTGDVTRVQSLYREIVEKDGTLASVVQARKLAIAAMEMQFMPVNKDDDSILTRQQVLALEQMRRGLSAAYVGGSNDVAYCTWDEMLLALLDAYPKGFSVIELGWKVDPITSAWGIDYAKFIDQSAFTFHGEDYQTPGEIRIRTDANYSTGERLPSRRYIVHYNKLVTGYPARFGYLRAAAWLYVLKSMSVKSLAMYCEKFGQPPVIFSYDSNDQYGEVKAREAAMRFGEDFIAALPNSIKAELMNIPTSTTLPQERMAAMINAEYAKLVLGQAATTEQTPGKLGNSTEQAELRYDIMEADARGLQATLNAQLIRPFLEMNFGECRAELKIKYEREEDRKQQAEIIRSVATVAPVPYSYIERELGIPQPIDGEPATKAHEKEVSMF